MSSSRYIVTECTIALHQLCLTILVVVLAACRVSGVDTRLLIACHSKDYESRNLQERSLIDELREACQRGEKCLVDEERIEEARRLIEKALVENMLGPLSRGDDVIDVLLASYILRMLDYVDSLRPSDCDILLNEVCSFKWYRCREHNVKSLVEKVRDCIPRGKGDRQSVALRGALEDIERWVLHGVLDAINEGGAREVLVYTHDHAAAKASEMCLPSILRDTSIAAAVASDAEGCGLNQLLTFLLLGPKGW